MRRRRNASADEVSHSQYLIEEAYMKHAPLTVLSMLAAWSVACAAHAGEYPPRSTARADAPVDEATFRTLDIDGDGYVSRLEVRRGTNLEREFDRLDTNRDGRLSREELRGMFPVERPGDAASRK